MGRYDANSDGFVATAESVLSGPDICLRWLRSRDCCCSSEMTPCSELLEITTRLREAFARVGEVDDHGGGGVQPCMKYIPNRNLRSCGIYRAHPKICFAEAFVDDKILNPSANHRLVFSSRGGPSLLEHQGTHENRHLLVHRRVLNGSQASS